jgi:hypothetical protein
MQGRGERGWVAGGGEMLGWVGRRLVGNSLQAR